MGEYTEIQNPGRSETALWDTTAVGPRPGPFAQTHRAHDTQREPSCELWTRGGGG